MIGTCKGTQNMGEKEDLEQLFMQQANVTNKLGTEMRRELD